MKNKLLLFALLLLGFHTVKAQLSNTAPVFYPEIDVTPQMQAAKNTVVFPNIV
jgi:hypothetical protein